MLNMTSASNEKSIRIIPTRKMFESYKKRTEQHWNEKERDTTWIDNLSDSIFEDVFDEAINEFGKQVGIETKPTLIDNNSIYKFQKKSNNFFPNKLNHYGFYNEEGKGCFLTIGKLFLGKIRDGEKIPIFAQSYTPYLDIDLEVYDEDYVTIDENWKENVKNKIIDEMKRCYEDEKEREREFNEFASKPFNSVITYSSPGSMYEGSCYSGKEWHQEKKECMNVGIDNFLNSGFWAFVTLEPYEDYSNYKKGDKVRYLPKDMECTETPRAYNCILKNKDAIKLID